MMRRLTILDCTSLDGIIQAPGAALAAGWGRDHRNVQCVDENRGAPSTGLPRLPAGDGAKNVTFATDTN
jgi:hypothetical protein